MHNLARSMTRNEGRRSKERILKWSTTEADEAVPSSSQLLIGEWIQEYNIIRDLRNTGFYRIKESIFSGGDKRRRMSRG